MLDRGADRVVSLRVLAEALSVDGVFPHIIPAMHHELDIPMCAHKRHRNLLNLRFSAIRLSGAVDLGIAMRIIVRTLRPMLLLGERIILEDQAEQETHETAVGNAFRRLGSIGSPHLTQVPYVPSDIR